MNSINEIQTDKINATLIKIETLQKEYEVTLQQYQEAVNNYIVSLQNNTDTNKFAALKGRTWWGTEKLTEGTVETQEECENMCATSSECSGATFNPVKRYCWTRKGDGTLSVGTDDDYALITQQKSNLSTMKYLNERLLELNEQINNELSNISPEIEEQNNAKNTTQEQLNLSYQSLLEQKLEMDKQLQEYYSIDENENNQSLYVNQQNVSLRFWALVTSIIVLITINKIVGKNNPPIFATIWFFIIILLIVLTYSLSTPAGFLMWSILISIIVLIKTGNL